MQGFAAGLVQPLVMATVVAVFPAERRGMAVGLYSVGVTMAPSFGPWIGGLAIRITSYNVCYTKLLRQFAMRLLLDRSVFAVRTLRQGNARRNAFV